MELSTEQIEIGFDANGDQVTIVVGNEAHSVQSVMVVESDFSKKPWNQASAIPFCRKPSSRNFKRSNLLGPESPLRQRPNIRDQPSSNRGRDSSRCERSGTSRGRSNSSPQRLNRRRKSPSGTKNRSIRDSRTPTHQHLRYDNSTRRTLPPGTAQSGKKSDSKRSKTFSIPRLRNNKVDPVLMVAGPP